MNKSILKLAIPNIISNITVPLLGLVDMILMGHLNSTAYIGAIALGGTIFSVLYSFFSFLRAGTTGFTAQSYGNNDKTETIYSLYRSISIGIPIIVLILSLQTPIAKLSKILLNGSDDVISLALTYFYIRIWGAPANILLYCLNGWFVGMQNTKAPMIIAILINVTNIILSYIFVFILEQNIKGVAIGTVLAQYCGLIVALILSIKNYKSFFVKINTKILFNIEKIKRFFKVNTDLMIRSILLILSIAFFTNQSAKLGNNTLAINMIILQSFYIFSYFTDGFAYAGEALTGRYIGAKDSLMVRKTVRWTFVWSMSIALIFMVIYQFAGVPMLHMMTSDAVVIEASRNYLPWLLLMPVAGCAAFTWDGIYIGATASRQMRNSMLWATVAFAALWTVGILLLGWLGSSVDSVAPGSPSYGRIAMHILMAAYFAHLLARTVYLSVMWRTIH